MKLNKKSQFLLNQLKKAMAYLPKRIADKIEDEVSLYFADKRSKLYRLKTGRSKEKKPTSMKDFKKGSNPKIIACRINGSKGGLATAMKHKGKAKEWGRKAGNATKARYGNDFFKHITQLRGKAK